MVAHWRNAKAESPYVQCKLKEQNFGLRFGIEFNINPSGLIKESFGRLSKDFSAIN